MALPNSMDVAVPAAGDACSSGDNVIAALKLFFSDVFGITSGSPYTGSAFTIATDGTVTFTQPLALPAGMMMHYGSATAPTGWLLCYGQAVNRTTYAALFTAISTLYGVGDGATTFNVPDLRGRMILGDDDMGGVAATRVSSATTIGATGGNQYIQNHAHDMGSHTHTLSAHTHTLGNHTHSMAITASSNVAVEGDDANNVITDAAGNLTKVISSGTGSFTTKTRSITGAPSTNTSAVPNSDVTAGPNTANTGNPSSAVVSQMNPWQLVTVVIKT